MKKNTIFDKAAQKLGRGTAETIMLPIYGPPLEDGVVTVELMTEFNSVFDILVGTDRFQSLTSQILSSYQQYEPDLPEWKVLWLIESALQDELLPLLEVEAITIDSLDTKAAEAISEVILGKFFARQNWLVRTYRHHEELLESLEDDIAQAGEAEVQKLMRFVIE